jgi:hypothetical protein
MRYLRWILLLVLAAGLALSLGACGSDQEDTSPPQVEPTQVVESQPTQAPTVKPTEPPQPTVAATDTPETESEEEEGLDTSTLSRTTDLSSYRSTTRITVTGTEDGSEVEQSLETLIEYTSEPLAQHMVMVGMGSGDAGAPGGLELYRVGDTTYMKVEDQWMSTPSTEDEVSAEGIITPEEMLADACGWKKKGSADVNGVEAEHWTVDKNDIETCMPSAGLMQIGGLTDAGGDLYIAKDGNYVVQMDFFYEGQDLTMELETDQGMTARRVEIHFEMRDVNEPFTIQVSEEALASSALPEDIPLPDDAADVNNMFGMITFTSAKTPEEVAGYYKAEMPKNGWTESSSQDMMGMFVAEYSKDGRTLNLMINTDDSGKTSVLITTQGGN